jgi:hypothetical protein
MADWLSWLCEWVTKNSDWLGRASEGDINWLAEWYVTGYENVLTNWGLYSNQQVDGLANWTSDVL